MSQLMAAAYSQTNPVLAHLPILRPARESDQTTRNGFHPANRLKSTLTIVFSSALRMHGAFLLATSADRARLMLPTSVLSDVECPVTSKYIALPASSRTLQHRQERKPCSRFQSRSCRLDAPIGHPVEVEKLALKGVRSISE
jgi:hypothetical protein